MSEDLIRRSDAIKVAKEFWYKPDIAGALAELPAIEPKKGKWILHPDDLFPAESTMECSVCHEHEFFSLCNENFCPNCGARMKGADDE